MVVSHKPLLQDDPDEDEETGKIKFDEATDSDSSRNKPRASVGRLLKWGKNPIMYIFWISFCLQSNQLTLNGRF
jgi:hypothetical protein